MFSTGLAFFAGTPVADQEVVQCVLVFGRDSNIEMSVGGLSSCFCWDPFEELG